MVREGRYPLTHIRTELELRTQIENARNTVEAKPGVKFGPWKLPPVYAMQEGTVAFDVKTMLEHHAVLRRSRQQELAQMQSGQLRIYEWKTGEPQRDITEEQIRRVLAEIAMLDSVDKSIRETEVTAPADRVTSAIGPSEPKTEAKYEPLRRHLQGLGLASVALTFDEIEKVLGASLPFSARSRVEWWANEIISKSRHVQCRAWQDAGYRAFPNLTQKTVTFRRSG